MSNGHLDYTHTHTHHNLHANHDAAGLSAAQLDDMLPPPGTSRWVARRKGQVIHAVRRGLLTIADACARYSISEEEYRSWEKLFDRHGTRALRVTRLKDYRRKYLQDGGGEGVGQAAS